MDNEKSEEIDEIPGGCTKEQCTDDGESKSISCGECKRNVYLILKAYLILKREINLCIIMEMHSITEKYIRICIF